jgi:chromate transporter
VIGREWGRIGVLGFGGPPAHVAMLRERVVDERGWIGHDEFEDAIAATNLLPGPASTQLAIFSAWRLRGAAGALIGGLAFVLPGLIAVLALSALFLAASPPEWVLAAGAGAGAAVAAVAVHAGRGLVGPSWARAKGRRRRWLSYAFLGGAAAAFAGPWVVLILIICGLVEVTVGPGWRPPEQAPGGGAGGGGLASFSPALAGLIAAAASTGGTAALAWVALKVGALSYGGGFVIIPIMQGDAVDTYGWMTNDQFLNAVALGQVTPGPVTHTVAAVGWAAGGLGGALLAAAVAFAPSFLFVLSLGPRFDALRRGARVRGFLDGAGPAAIGAILGVSIPLAAALGVWWQFLLLAGALVALLLLGRSVVATLLGAAAVGVVVVALGAALP